MTDIKPNQIEKLLLQQVELKEKLLNAREILRSYKIQSERLTQLKRAKRDMNEQIEEEKKTIEDKYLEDKDYETAANDELTLKNQLKEKNAELREVMASVNKAQDLSTYDYNIKGEKLKLQVQRVVKVYINGKEEK
jgi:hypothetical protein